MIASASVASYRLVSSFSPSNTSRFKSLKAFSSLPVPKSTPPSLLSGSLSTRPVSVRKMEIVRTRALGTSDGDEGHAEIEREAGLGNVSSAVVPDFASGGLDTTFNRLSKWLVTAVFGTVILVRHDAEALWAAMGSIVNVVICVALKRILNQKRPVPTLKSDPGMPSSHAQSIFFAVFFIILSLVEWLGVNEVSIIVGTFVLACGSYLSWIRVSQQYHTLSQVLVGAVLGSVCCVLWFWLWDEFVLRAFDSLLWVRLVVLILASGCCLAFSVYTVLFWFRREQ